MESSKAKLSLLSRLNSRQGLWAVVIGLLLAASFPPMPFPFLMYIAFVPILYIIDERIKEGRKIMGFIYLTALIWNWGCGYWIGFTAFGVDEGEKFMAATTGILANFANALLMCIPLLLYKRFRKKYIDSPYSLLALIPFWIAFEYLHCNWDLSWSWYNLGISLSYMPRYIQYLEWTGVLGATFHILFANILLYWLIKEKSETNIWHKKIGYGLVAWLALPLLLSFYFLNENRAIYKPSGSLNVRIIQPNVNPFSKYSDFSPEAQVAMFDSLINLPGLDSMQLVVMPETAVPRYIWANEIDSTKLIRPLWNVVRIKKVPILTGVIEARFYEPTATNIPVAANKYGRGFYVPYNASVVMPVTGKCAFFEKGKLVPFVERTPFMDELPFMKHFLVEIGGGYGGYGKPDSIHPIRVKDGVKVGTMICYESVYGDYIRKLTKQNADFLAILTNDGWWQKTSGYIQHQQMTVLRAIENRRDIVRSANTGTSLFADSKGNLRQKTDYWVRTIVDGKINLYKEKTLYVLWGDYLGWISVILGLGIFIATFLKRKL